MKNPEEQNSEELTSYPEAKLQSLAKDLREVGLQQIFDELSAPLNHLEERWDADNCLNVHLWGDFSGQLSSVAGLQENNFVLDEKLSSGNLYRYRFPECNYFMFVHNDFARLGEKVHKTVSRYFELNGFIWFSYLRGGCEFRWHKDKVPGRMHFPLKNSGKTPAIEDVEGNVFYMQEGQAYAFDPKISHRVPPQFDERLHLVASINTEW